MARYDDVDDNDWGEEDDILPRGSSGFTFQDGLFLIGAITIGAIVVYFIIKWLEQNIRMPPPNYGLPQTPYWSPYPYSPYMPGPVPPQPPTPVVSTTPACPPCVCGAPAPAPVMIPGPTGVPVGVRSSWVGRGRGRTINSEKWDVHRDKRGAISSVEVHRDARED